MPFKDNNDRVKINKKFIKNFVITKRKEEDKNNYDNLI